MTLTNLHVEIEIHLALVRKLDFEHSNSEVGSKGGKDEAKTT